MITRTACVTCLLLAATWLCVGCGESRDQAEIRGSFDGYYKAIHAADGEAAAAVVDNATIQYYDRMLGLALRGARQEVGRLSMLDRMMVFTIRHRVPLATAQRMTGKDLFIHGVRQGWIGKDAGKDIKLGEISISGTTAEAAIESNGQRAPFKWTFHKEGGAWKMDLTSIMPAGNRALSSLAARGGMDEDELILKSLELVSEAPLNRDSIYKPMITP
jgi:hypothetical protein